MNSGTLRAACVAGLGRGLGFGQRGLARLARQRLPRVEGWQMAPTVAAIARLSALMPATGAGEPTGLRKGFVKQIRLFGPSLPPVVIESITLTGAAGPLRARVYRPPANAAEAGAPALLYFHGGGFVVGDLDSTHAVCALLAWHSGCVVVSAEYRLAPEHPWPAAPHDALAAWHDLWARAPALGLDRARLAVGGDSAGANLAAVVAQQTRGPQGPRYQLLIYPATELGHTAPSHRAFAGVPLLLTADAVRFYVSQYRAEASHPLASPLFGPAEGVAPAHVITCAFDVLRDEGHWYAARLRAAGVPVGLTFHPDLTHGWINILGLLSEARPRFEALAVNLAAALAPGALPDAGLPPPDPSLLAHPGPPPG